RVVLPHELVAPVAADVVERAYFAVEAAHDDDRRLGDGELLGEVAPVARQLLHPPDVQPHALEDGVALELVERRGHRGLVRDGRGAELGIVLGPAPLGRLGEPPRAHLSRSWPRRAGPLGPRSLASSTVRISPVRSLTRSLTEWVPRADRGRRRRH